MNKIIDRLSGSGMAKKALQKMVDAGEESVKDLSPEDISGIAHTMDILMGHGFRRGMLVGVTTALCAMIGAKEITKAILKKKQEKTIGNQEEKEDGEGAE